MKKFLILTLVVAALCLALASCGKETPTTTQSAHQHVPGAWVTVKHPSCQDGEQSQFCATCGELLQTLPIAATGVHVEMIDKAVEPTCTSTGLTEGKHCMTCGKTFVAQVEVPKIAHSYDDKNDETCNFCGFVRDVTCKHTDVTVMESKDATCTEAGLTKGIVCNGCEEILQVQEVIDALGHHGIVDYGYDATCTEAGLTDGKHCDRCEEILVAQSYIKALGHNESEWIIEKEPTETKDGYKYKTCSICKEKTQEEIIPYIGDLGLDYTVNSDGETCTVTGIGTFEGTVLNIPDYIRQYKVVGIGENAFADCTKLREIKIPEMVETIGTRAFYGCTGLTEITIPSSVTSIGNQIFYKADNLNTVYYNSTYGSKSNNFLSIASIQKVVFGGKYVPNYALYNCANIETVEFVSNITSIGDWAFDGCSSLTSVTIPDSVTSIGYDAFRGCSSLTSIEIPDSVTSIGYQVFYGCSSLTSIEIPDSVTSIGDSAFRNCSSLTSIVIPDSVTSIGNYAFRDCTSLTSIEIPDSVTSIGSDAFYNCSLLTSIEIPDSVTSIGSSAFQSCKSLTSIVIPDSVTSIGSKAFYNCSRLTIYCEVESKPSGWASDWNSWNYDYNRVPVIWSYDLSNGLQYTINPDGQSYSVTGIGTCTDTDIVIPETYEGLPVTSIGDGAFSGCSLLTSINISNSVTSIGEDAFYNCSSLISIVIPDSVTSIGNNAFYGCSSLIIYCEAKEQPIGWESDWNKLDSESEIHVVWNKKNEVYVSISFDNIFNRTSFSETQQIWNAPGITVINNKGMADIADYHNPVRFYSSSQVIVIANNMVQIEFVCNTEDYASALGASLPEGTVYFVSGRVVIITFEEAVDSFEIASMNGQVRVDSITVY